MRGERITRLGPVPLGGDSEGKGAHTDRARLGGGQAESQAGQPRSGVPCVGDKAAELAGELLGKI